MSGPEHRTHRFSKEAAEAFAAEDSALRPYQLPGVTFHLFSLWPSCPEALASLSSLSHSLAHFS